MTSLSYVILMRSEATEKSRNSRKHEMLQFVQHDTYFFRQPRLFIHPRTGAWILSTKINQPLRNLKG